MKPKIRKNNREKERECDDNVRHTDAGLFSGIGTDSRSGHSGSCGSGECAEENGYSRAGKPSGVKRATALMIAMLVLIQVLVYVFKVVPEKNKACCGAFAGRSSDSIVSLPAAEKPVPEKSLFEFNPNSIDSSGLLRLGFSSAQASSIIKYRRKGGNFRKPEDFSRLYVVSERKYRELESYIKIPARKDSGGQVVRGGAARKGAGLLRSEDVSFQARTICRGGMHGLGGRSRDFDRRTESGWRAEGAGCGSVSSAKTPSRRSAVDINAAGAEALDSLPGIGKYFAAKIMEYRSKLGGFSSADQLLEIEGFGKERLERLRGRITVSEFAKINLMTADSAFMAAHPYIGGYRYRAIRFFISYMRSQGKDSVRMEDILANDVIVTDKAAYLLEIFE